MGISETSEIVSQSNWLVPQGYLGISPSVNINYTFWLLAELEKSLTEPRYKVEATLAKWTATVMGAVLACSQYFLGQVHARYPL